MSSSDLTCEKLIDCEFFISEITIESIAKRYKEKYCNSCKDACARYMVFSVKSDEEVPSDLYPNEYDKALSIMSKL